MNSDLRCDENLQFMLNCFEQLVALFATSSYRKPRERS
jgi:hypothetical protein